MKSSGISKKTENLILSCWPFDNWKPTRKLGSGGSGAVYSAVNVFRQTAAPCAVKAIYLSDRSKKRLQEKIDAAGAEYDRLDELKNCPCVVQGCDYSVVKKEEEGYAVVFLRMDLLSAAIIDDREAMKCVSEVFQMAADLLTALKAAHGSRIFHGDIKPQNVLYNEADGHYRLADFGVSVKVTGGSVTGRGTQSFVAPEVWEAHKRHTPISDWVRSDLYSLGMTLYFYLNGAHMPADLFERRVEKREEVPAPKYLTDELEPFFRRLVAYKLEDRFASAEEAYAELEKIPTFHRVHLSEFPVLPQPARMQPTYSLSHHVSSPDFFLEGSRDAEIRQIKDAFASGTNPIVIFGTHGVGKTETAIRAAQELQHGNVYLLRYQKSVKKTVMDMRIAGYTFCPTSENLSLTELETEEFQDRLRILAQHFGDDVFILDNFEDRERSFAQLRAEEAYRELLSTGIRLIITTSTVPGTGLRIPELREDQLLDIMRNYCSEETASDDVCREMIRATEANTLIATVIAKTLDYSFGDITPEQMQEAVSRCGMSLLDAPAVSTDYNRDPKERKIFEIVRRVFDVSALAPQTVMVLAYVALFPPDALPVATFRRWLTKKEWTRFSLLCKCGWLTLGQDRKTVKMHPLVRDLFEEEAVDVPLSMNPFMKRMIRYMSAPDTAEADLLIAVEALVRGVYSPSYGILSCWIPGNRWANAAGSLYLRLGRYERAVVMDWAAISFNPDRKDLEGSRIVVRGAFGLLSMKKRTDRAYLEHLREVALAWNGLPEAGPKLPVPELPLPQDDKQLAKMASDFSRRVEIVRYSPCATYRRLTTQRGAEIFNELGFFGDVLSMLTDDLPDDADIDDDLEAASLLRIAGDSVGMLLGLPKQLEYEQASIRLYEDALAASGYALPSGKDGGLFRRYCRVAAILFRMRQYGDARMKLACAFQHKHETETLQEDITDANALLAVIDEKLNGKTD